MEEPLKSLDQKMVDLIKNEVVFYLTSVGDKLYLTLPHGDRTHLFPL